MKKRLGRWMSAAVLSAALAAGTFGTSSVFAAETVDFDSFTEALATDYSQAAQLPLTGWYEKNFEDGRSVKFYISEEAEIRTYVTIVAVPDGVDSCEFIEAEGWKAVADAQGEAVYVLEPGEEGWGSAAEEEGYLAEAIGFLSSTRNANNIAVFSTFGEHYAAGYGKGAAALESWAAKNPILVIAQAYIDGKSSGTDALTAAASTVYDGKNGNGDLTDVLQETIAQVGIDGTIAPKDIPVPTCLAKYTGSEDYWKENNDCTAEAADGVYHQDLQSDAYATDFANQYQKEDGAEYGISEVCITDDALTAADIYTWMSTWTRYDTTFAYSNALGYRLNYQAARVEAQKTAKDGTVKSCLSDGTEIWGQADVEIEGHGTVQAGVVAFADQSGDGVKDPCEYLAYIPAGYEDKDLPLLLVYPGNSQTDVIFMDSTMWWQIADREGIVLMFVCQTYNPGGVTVSHYDSEVFYHSLIAIAKEQLDGQYAKIDFSRIYASGQSAGSNTTQSFAVSHPEFFAAVATTSGSPITYNQELTEIGPTITLSYDGEKIFTYDMAANRQIPVMIISGHSDVGDCALLFDSLSLKAWAEYFQSAAGIEGGFAAESADVSEMDSRHPETYTWSNAQGIPMVRWARCLLRPHNCYPGDMPHLWDYMKHYSFETTEDGTITRYYSESAFAEDDAQVILANE